MSVRGQGSGADEVTCLRLDKWLWFARFFKTRTLATRFVQSGKLRINKQPVSKPHHPVRPGDVLTFALRGGVKIIEIKALGLRRGPAPEARALYEDLSPPPVRSAGQTAEPATVAPRPPGTGRPTKRQRRDTDRFKGDAGSSH